MEDWHNPDGDAMLREVQAWARINSGTRNLAGLKTMAGVLSDAFSALPGELRLVDPDPVDTVGIDGVVRPLEHGQHLHLCVRPHASAQMLFTGHMDTVYGIDHPFQQQRFLEDGTLNGPGVTDMKGGLSVMLAALKGVEASGKADNLGYEIVINADEETGSLSSATLLTEAARGKMAAFTYEPALPDGTLVGERGGTGNFSILVRGRSAHAGRNPEDGRNAIVGAADIATRLAAVGRPGLSVNPARIDGGGPNNVVPDLAILRVNLRPRTQTDIAAAHAAIDDSVDAVKRDHDVFVEVHGGFNRPPKPLDSQAERLFALVETVGREQGLGIARRATGGVCDGNNIAAMGVPVIDTMGVRGGAIHSADEFLIVESLTERAQLSAAAILRIAAGHW